MDIKKSMQSIKAAFSCLLITAGLSLGLGLSFSSNAFAEIELTPKWTERYLFKHNPELVKNTHLDQVLSFYYFGSFQNFTIMGLERVKGDDYHQYNTVLIFKDSVLQGYYEELAVFPAGVDAQGIVNFPANSNVVENIDLGQSYYPAMIFSRDKKLNPETHEVSKFSSIKSQTGEQK
jgi:hypothetical protein